MVQRLRPVAAAIIALALGACNPSASVSTTTDGTLAETTTTTSATTTATSDQPVCLTGTQPFVSTGGAGVIERDDTDARIISGIRWTSYDECDRIILEFSAASGAPAVSPPGVGPLFIRSAGVLRLQLDQVVASSAVIDQTIGTALVSHAFVVRRATGELFVDLHMGAPVTIRVTVASGPARIVIDAVPGGTDYSSPPIVTDDLVVVDPIGGELIYPFTVNGYVRGQVAAMTVVLATGSDDFVFEGEVGAQSDAWGAFTVLVSDGPVGPASLLVGERIPMTVELS
jgi:hypothetical protein